MWDRLLDWLVQRTQEELIAFSVVLSLISIVITLINLYLRR
jgi:hypothetical protein